MVLSIGHGSIGEAGKDIFMKVVGRGGGNFEMIIPRDLTVSKGDQVVLPGISPYVVGIVETITSRLKMKNIPQYLLFATAIGILNLLIYTFTK